MKQLTLILCLIYTFSFGQKRSFERITEKDGLVNSNITSIKKDSRGYMWFGTYNGLSKFNGYTFVNYIYNSRDTNSVSGGQVSCIYETKNKTLIVGFQYHGLSIYNKEKDNFTRIEHSPKNSSSLVDNYVLTIFEDSKNRIWIGTKTGLELFDLKTKTFKHYLPFKTKELSHISSIIEDKEGKLWLYGIGNEICQFNPEKNTYQHFRFKEDQISDKILNKGGSILFGPNGTIWICNMNVGIYVFDILKKSSVNQFNTANGILKTNNVMCLKKLTDGNIWIGTDGAGIYIYNPQNGSFTEIVHNEHVNSIAGNGVYAIEEFDDKIVWVGSYGSGVSKWVRSKSEFNGFNSQGELNKKLSKKSVLAMVEDKNGLIWIGTDGGGLNLFDPKTETFKYYNSQNSDIPFDVIKSISIDYKGNLWLGSFQKGICLWDPKKEKVLRHDKESLNKSNNTIDGDNVWTLLCSKDKESLYVGMLNKGLDIFNFKTNKYEQHDNIVNPILEDLTKTNILALTEVHNGLWISTQNNGASFYDPVSKKCIRFTAESSKSRSLPTNEIRDIFEDSKGQIWFATVRGGLCKLIDFKTQTFKSYSQKYGLNTDNVMCILEDPKGNLWLSTDKGIAVFDPKKESFRHFTTDDGLLTNDHNYNSKLKDKQGNLYFGGIDGFSFFNPDSILFNKNKPKVAIVNLYILNDVIIPNYQTGHSQILTKCIDLTDEIKIHYTDNIIKIEFAALEYVTPSKNKYAYYLNGFENSWHFVSSDNRLATYTNLDPGIYTFKIKASNSDGIWGPIKSLKIIVNPPWYMTIWFRLASFILFVSLISGYYLYKLKSIKEQNVYLEAEVKKRISVIEQQKEEALQKTLVIEQQQKVKDKFYSIVAHDLKNPVSALVILSDMLSAELKDTGNAEQIQLMRHIEVSSKRLKNLVVDLLEWARSHSTDLKLDIVELNALQIVTENIEIQKGQAILKNIQLTSNIELGQYVIVDKQMFQTIIRNLLSNAIKFTHNGGEIVIATYFKTDDTITIMFKDNGIGMSQEVINQLFNNITNPTSKGTNNEQGTGLGLTIVKEFIELNHGKLEIESISNQGTCFYVHLPGKFIS